MADQEVSLLWLWRKEKLIKVGQVYSNYGVRYQVLAIWDNYAWLHISSIRVSKQPKDWEAPQTFELDFLRQPDMALLYELPE